MTETRFFQPEDQAGCLKLLREGHDPTFSRERFVWLHEKGPFGESQIVVEENAGQIVGFYAMAPRVVRLGPHSYRGARDLDPVVHPDHRGRGIFGRMLDFALGNIHNVDFLFNFANPASAEGFRHKGWHDARPLIDYVMQTSFAGPALKSSGLWMLTGARTRDMGDPSARELAMPSASDVVMGMLARTHPAVPPNELWVERSGAFVRWRYLDNPLRKYRWFVFGDDERPGGLAICRHVPERNQLFILDVLGLNRAATLAPWYDLWRQLFPKTWICVWSGLPSAMRPCFVSCRSKRNRGQTFLVKPLPQREAPPALLQRDAWRLTHGDLEIA